MAVQRTRRWAVVVGVALVASVAVAPPAGADDAEGPPDNVEITEEAAELRAAVLATEDRRITEIRAVTSLARWQGKNWKTPYRLGTAAGYTLVLTPRSTPYTVDDLFQLAPQTFLQMSDGSFLLSEHIVVMARATLRLSNPGGMTLRLASAPTGFATIVSFGGKVEIVGDDGAEVEITSWDVDAAAVDEQLDDGRAYIRAIGGQFEAAYAHLTHLGFWSGRTGGLSLTGTDRPNTGAIESFDPDVETGPLSLLDDVIWQPAGPLDAGQTNVPLDLTVPALDYVSSRISNVKVDHSAYGLFVSGANGVQVTDSAFDDNQQGGVVLHRYVTNGSISRTTANRNAGDGFALARATTGIVISESTASYNAGSGFSLDGRALADGPSAAGASLRSYGNNSIVNSTAIDNAEYGISLSGGFNIGLQSNTIEGHDMGIMVIGPARRISVTGNTVIESDRHGVALVDGVMEATVTGNVVDRSTTGVYVRDSNGLVKGNTIEDASSHGVSFVGGVDGSEVSFNVLAGSGASALDTRRSNGDIDSASNNTDGWHDTTPWYMWFKKLLQPMSLLWSVLALLIVVSAVRSRRANGVIVHPYAHQMAHHGVMPVPRPDVAEEPWRDYEHA